MAHGRTKRRVLRVFVLARGDTMARRVRLFFTSHLCLSPAFFTSQLHVTPKCPVGSNIDAELDQHDELIASRMANPVRGAPEFVSSYERVTSLMSTAGCPHAGLNARDMLASLNCQCDWFRLPV